ncbi:hypothetical protein [Sporosarcina sp. JAI121]|uniref:hypothetical protein n=1 Tax=Sporosarcina sp. JAI121 TaxID=2723064 RepID=UPI0015C8017C|nr:hypothetical protein [Sporosarcina sp. JAI121]NYF24017.1 hypothetical protein [Sporosarcina sp. JAI121]
MGYILPIQPIQSQMYANRLNMEFNDFAHIDRVSKVKLDPDFSEELDESNQQEREMEEDEGESIVKAPPAYQGFVYPNPVNLSPLISQVVGKGLSVNVYI